jgi:hypothetical protein
MSDELLDQAVAGRIAVECMHGDTEEAHSHADDILCELLSNLGYHETVKAWLHVDKWYA